MEHQVQKVHFIAIGGSVMHSLAIALRKAGHSVTGSDDEIYEPSRSALAFHGLLPGEPGWFPEKLGAHPDAVVLGMHAKIDNPELIRAQQLGLKIYSFPEYVYDQSIDKQRIVIAGSHGKTTITGIVIHVLNYFHRNFDYVIGSGIKGIEETVKLSDAPIIIIEGDEYLSSAIDPTPKFLRYQHHMGLISGIAWDHANVFPDEESYVKQFDKFADNTPKGGILLFSESDALLSLIGGKQRSDVLNIPYKSHPHASESSHQFLSAGKERIPIKLFGGHNFQNIGGAKELLKRIGITTEQFFEAIQSFEGAAGRLEKVLENNTSVVYSDFAHAPSKVRASVKAVREIYPSRDLIACLELHTYSSLSKNFLPQYKDSLKGLANPVIYFNPEKVKAKNLEPINEKEIRNAFGNPTLQIFTEASQVEDFLSKQSWKNKNLLMMSSGNFGGINIKKLAEKILQ